MTHHGRSFWIAGFPKSRQPSWPIERGQAGADVAIVGGGLTGCTIAFVFAAAGIRVALCDAGRIGQGATGNAAGLLSLEPSPRFVDLEAACGRRNARRMVEMYRKAALDFAALLRRLRVRCGLERQDAAWLATDRDAEKWLRREHDGRSEAGVGTAWLRGARLRRESGVEAAGAIVTPGSLVLDPYRACVGLARAAAARGCGIFERTRLVGGRRARNGIELKLASGTLTASAVVLATGAPPPLVRPLARHFDLATTYHVVTPPLPAAIRKAMGTRALALRDTARPEHRLRWTSDNRVLFSGADQPSVPARSRDRVLVQRSGQLMYELSLFHPVISGIQPDFGWDEPVARTADGIPYIGTHRNYPRHLFALGADQSGAASALLAARILLRAFQGEPAKGDELFGFGRRL